MIVMINGMPGTGKTCILTRYCLISKANNMTIMSNYDLKNIDYGKLDIVDLYYNKPDLKNVMIAGDELYTFMDCRMSMSKRNRIESYFIAQCRKKRTDLYFTSQFSSFVDVRIIQFIDIIIEMENFWVLNKKLNRKEPHPYLFKMTLTDYRNPKNITRKVRQFDGRPWFNEYDTDEPIYPPDDIDNVTKKLSKRKSKSKKSEISQKKPDNIVDAKNLF